MHHYKIISGPYLLVKAGKIANMAKHDKEKAFIILEPKEVLKK